MTIPMYNVDILYDAHEHICNQTAKIDYSAL